MSLFHEYEDLSGKFKICIFSIEDTYTSNPEINVPEHIQNPYKRIQYQVAREALLSVDPTFPLNEVKITETGKPYVEGYDKSFSLSHSSNYAAAMVSDSESCGFDIELPGRKVSSIKDKFISPNEYSNIEPTLRQFFPTASDFIFYGLCWSAKESVYKWLGRRDLDFRNNMELFPSPNNFNTHTPFLNCKVTAEGEDEKILSVYMQLKKPLVITWVLDSASESND